MKAFYAYPSSPVDVTQVIHAAKHILLRDRRDLELHLWEENDISGRPLTDRIFEGIAGADILVADITAMNFNVTFEIGYAIGLGKRIYLTRDGNITRDRALADRIGIFDTLGFETYTDEQHLSELFKTYRLDARNFASSGRQPQVPRLRPANAPIQLGDDRNHCSDQKGPAGV